MKNNNLRIFTLAGLVTLGALVIACKPKVKQGQAGGAVPVKTYTVQKSNFVFYDTWPCVVTATNEVQIRSEVSGYITGVYFKEGAQVSKGMKLYEIDRRKYQAAYEAAKDAVEIANENLIKAKRDADRYRKLDEQKAIAKQVLDDAITAESNAGMQLKSSNANLLSAETDFNYSLITAPFGGSIGFSQVKPGAFVISGQTLLNTISSDDPMGVDFTIDEKSLPYFHKLQSKASAEKDSTFRLILPDNSEYPYSGRLSIIDRAIDPLTGTIRIRTVFPNHDQNLRPGMNCKIKVLDDNSGVRVSIPAKALMEQMSEFFVFVVDTNKTVKQQKVSVGPAHGESVIINNGLTGGEKIVIEGIQKIHNGSMITEADMAKNEGSNQPARK